MTGSRVIRSQTGSRAKPSPRLWMTRSTSRSLKIPISFFVVVDDGQGTDVVLHQLGDRLADGRLAVDRDDPTPLGFQYVADQHRALPR